MNIVSYNPRFSREIADLFHDTVHAVASGAYTPAQVAVWAPTPPDYARWRERLAHKQPFAAVEWGQVIGFIELDPDGHIDCLYTHKDHQRRGVATALYQHLEAVALERGIQRLYVEASHLAKLFFAQQGFTTIRSNIVTVADQQLKNFTMEKLLTNR